VVVVVLLFPVTITISCPDVFFFFFFFFLLFFVFGSTRTAVGSVVVVVVDDDDDDFFRFLFFNFGVSTIRTVGGIVSATTTAVGIVVVGEEGEKENRRSNKP